MFLDDKLFSLFRKNKIKKKSETIFENLIAQQINNELALISYSYINYWLKKELNFIKIDSLFQGIEKIDLTDKFSIDSSYEKMKNDFDSNLDKNFKNFFLENYQDKPFIFTIGGFKSKLFFNSFDFNMFVYQEKTTIKQQKDIPFLTSYNNKNELYENSFNLINKIKKSQEIYSGILPAYTFFHKGKNSKKPINDENFEEMKLVGFN